MKIFNVIILFHLQLLAVGNSYADIKSDIDVSTEELPPYRHTSKTNHEMRIITSGSAALNARIEMIRSAKKSLDLEYFVFNNDTSGGLILKELAKAADRGVKVRVLVDKAINVFKLNEYYAESLKEKGIELRYYNPAPLIKVSSVQFRNHRKLIVKDGVEAITGGRNIGDDYFDLSEDYNFLDRDTSIEGEVVGSMQETFERYWNSKIVEVPEKPRAPVKEFGENEEANERSYQHKVARHQKKIKKARDIFLYTDKDKKALDFVMTEGKKNLDVHKKSNCPTVTFATDREGASFLERLDTENYEDNYRLLRKEIGKWIFEKVDKELVIDSPYFLDNTLSRYVGFKLLEANKKISILTNSLDSTDAVQVSSVFNDSIGEYVKNENFKAYLYKGGSNNETNFLNDKIKNGNWGTHSKTMLFNDDSFMIGTFNIDNRSSFYNTEMAIFCSGSPELAKTVKENIDGRKNHSHELDTKGNPIECGASLMGNSDPLKKLMYYMVKIPGYFFKHLL